MRTIFDYRAMFFAMALIPGASCSVKQQDTAGQAKEYLVMEIKEDTATLYKEYPTSLQGIQTVEIRPKVAGYIEEIRVDEGAHVKKGQTLFVLDSKDITATVRSAEAQVKVAEAAISNAKINLGKTKPLVEKNIISSFDLESAEATLQSAEAQLAQAKANLANAQANLQYTIISSPTQGIIGNFPYRVGSLVSSAISQPLTSISNTASMYAYFSMNEKEFISLSKNLEGKNIQEKLTRMPAVTLILADNTPYENPGKIETASGLVDQQTGAINIRATFPNKDGLLQSGSSGKVRLPQHISNAILIPQKAAYELQGKQFVYVVGEDNKVKNTEIEVLTGNLKDSYVVTSGLKAGDRIVIEGIATLKNDMPVQPKLAGTDKPEQSSSSENQVKN
ncbi:MAG: efflux RND transporter periplasmic adaptor subunit [Prolixibacteraceae bacterium]